MANYPPKDTPPASPLESIPAPSGASNLIDTDYVIGQDNFKSKFLDIHSKVFSISALAIILFVISLIAGALGFTGLARGLAGLAKRLQRGLRLDD